MLLQGTTIEPTDVIRCRERVAFFVDAANVTSAARALGFKIDWQSALDLFVGDGVFADAHYYAIGPLRTNIAKLDALSHTGFTIHAREAKHFVDGLTGEPIAKRVNFESDIAVDMLCAAPTYDVAFLFSGNSAFARLVLALRHQGKRVYVVSTLNTIARELAYAANKPVFLLEHYKSLLARKSPSNDTEAVHTQRTGT